MDAEQKARELCEKLDRTGCATRGGNDCVWCPTIIRALREAKAQAYTDMAVRYESLYEIAYPAPHIKMDVARERELAFYRGEGRYCREQAAALRSKQDAPAKCADCGAEQAKCPRWTKTPNGQGGFYHACCPDCECPDPAAPEKAGGQP